MLRKKMKNVLKPRHKVTIDSADNNKSVKLNAKNVGDFISNIIDKSRGQGKTTIKIQIESCHE